MSMENFFNWMSKPIPREDIIIWFNVHNMSYEKIELFGDIFKSLQQNVQDTYMGDDINETKISMTQEDKELHFEWCWKKIIDEFMKEGININSDGEHKNYFKGFYLDTFYNPTDRTIRNSIPSFLLDVFDVDKPFAKSDLDILTELYKLLEKNIE
jgi:hypothetical protein